MSTETRLGNATHPGDAVLTRRRFLQAATAAACTAGPLGGAGCLRRGDSLHRRRPNLLFVFSDQQSYDMLGCYGNDQIITPRLDAFAGEGVRFTHCVSNQPVCTPYRGILFSGQHPLTNGCFFNDIQMLPDPQRFASVLQRMGYRTGYIGKWHLYGGDRDRGIPPGPLRYGFDGLFKTDNCTVDFRAEHSFYFDDAGRKIPFPPEDGWEVTTQTRQAIEFIDEGPDEQPFALFLSWHPPHDQRPPLEYETLPRLMDQYDPNAIRPRPNCPPEHFRRDWYHGHMAMCTGLDEAFGQLLDSLRARGIEDDTLVVYTSDHGDLLQSHGFPESKAMPHEESIGVPLLMRWPGRLPAGTTSDLMVGTLDLMPTLLSLIGGEPPAVCQGHDLADAIRSGRNEGPEYQPIYHFYVPGRLREGRPAPLGWRGVRTHRYTYAEALQRGPWILYDNQADPFQISNLIDAPEHDALRRELAALTHNSMRRFGDEAYDGDALMARCIGPQGVPLGRPVDLMADTRTGKATWTPRMVSVAGG